MLLHKHDIYLYIVLLALTMDLLLLICFQELIALFVFFKGLLNEQDNSHISAETKQAATKHNCYYNCQQSISLFAPEYTPGSKRYKMRTSQVHFFLFLAGFLLLIFLFLLLDFSMAYGYNSQRPFTMCIEAMFVYVCKLRKQQEGEKGEREMLERQKG